MRILTKQLTMFNTQEVKTSQETEIVVVLDRSGSMSTIIDGTIEGFNSFLKEQKGAAGEAFITLVQFDDRYQVDYKSVNVKHIADLSKDTYQPRGSTALYDAIGKTINELNTTRDVVFVIITDGAENCSKEFINSKMVKQLIESKEKEGKWKFLFLGANQDAVLTGSTMGIRAEASMSYTGSNDNVKNVFHSVSSNTASYRTARAGGASADSLTMGFSEEQRKDALDNQ